MLVIAIAALSACGGAVTYTPLPDLVTTETGIVPGELQLESFLPADNATGVGLKPILEWGEVEGAESYELSLAEDTENDNFFAVIDYGAATTVNSHALLPTLLYDTTYNWRVRVGTVEGFGPWVTASFTTEFESDESRLARGARVIPLEPEDAAEDTANRPLLKWDDILGAPLYELEIAEDIGHSNPFAIITYSAIVTATLHIPAEVLVYDTTYNWRVRPVDSPGVVKPWVVSSFTTEASLGTPKVTLPVLPQSAYTDIRPNLTWQPVEGATSYALIIAELTEEEDPFASMVLATTTVNNTHRGWAPLKYSTEYNWWVRAQNENGGVGRWTTSSFKTEPDLSLLAAESFSPSPGKTGVFLRPTFGWDEIPGATAYQFAISEDTGQNNPFAVIGYRTTQTENLVVVPREFRFNYGVRYAWRVRAISDVVSAGPWVVAYFTARMAPLDLPVTRIPDFAEAGVSPRPMISWGFVNSATEYQIEISRDRIDRAPFAVIDYVATTSSNFHIVRGGLDYATTYTWRVRAVSSIGPGPWSASHFIVMGAPEE